MRTICERIVDPPQELQEGQRNCFWCQRAFWKGELTKDHLEPASLGGADEYCNLVRACSECNNERGLFPAMFRRGHQTFAKTDPLAQSWAVKKYLDKVVEVVTLQMEWRDLEILRLGWSPSWEIVIPESAEDCVKMSKNAITSARRHYAAKQQWRDRLENYYREQRLKRQQEAASAVAEMNGHLSNLKGKT
jgi:hypothetical protein